MLIRMVEAGNVAAEDGGDVILELFEKEQELAGNVNGDQEEMDANPTLDLGFQAFSQTLMSREYQLTSRIAFSSLQAELVSTFESGSDDGSRNSNNEL